MGSQQYHRLAHAVAADLAAGRLARPRAARMVEDCADRRGGERSGIGLAHRLDGRDPDRRLLAARRAISLHGRHPEPAALRISQGSGRSEEHTSELQSLMRISYAVFCLKKKKLTINCTYLKDNSCSYKDKTHSTLT